MLTRLVQMNNGILLFCSVLHPSGFQKESSIYSLIWSDPVQQLLLYNRSQ